MTSRKLGRYAALTTAYCLIVPLLFVGVVPEWAGLAVTLVFVLPLLWSWGAYQADLACNEAVDEPERQVWRVAFCVLPPTMAVYWWRYVRPVYTDNDSRR